MNMMDEYTLMERIKERLCYVARDVRAELRDAKAPREANTIAREYVLPDGVTILRGYVKGDDAPEGAAKRAAPGAAAPAEQARPSPRARALCTRPPHQAHTPCFRPIPSHPSRQLLPLCNERFMVPEALLHPTDIGSPQAGLAEAAAAAVGACGADIRALLWSNVILTGARWRPLRVAPVAATLHAAG